MKRSKQDEQRERLALLTKVAEVDEELSGLQGTEPIALARFDTKSNAYLEGWLEGEEKMLVKERARAEKVVAEVMRRHERGEL